jgi:hypothetical protein
MSQSVVAPLAIVCRRMLVFTLNIYNTYKPCLFSYTNKEVMDPQYVGIGRSSRYDFHPKKWKYAVK